MKNKFQSTSIGSLSKGIKSFLKINSEEEQLKGVFDKYKHISESQQNLKFLKPQSSYLSKQSL